MAYIKKLNGYVIRDEEAHTKIATVEGKVSANATSIDNIIKGTTTVGTAEYAQLANKALYDGNNNSIVKTYATKTELGETNATLTALKGSIEGNKTAYVFGTYSDLNNALEADASKYKVGDQLLIMDGNVPDYWVAVAPNNDTLTTVPDGANVIYPTGETSGGYYIIVPFEADIDLTGYSQVIHVTGAAPSKLVNNAMYIVTPISGNYGPINVTVSSGNIGSAAPNILNLPNGVPTESIILDENEAINEYKVIWDGSNYILYAVGDTATTVTVSMSYSSKSNDYFVVKDNVKYHFAVANNDGAALKAIADENGNKISTTYATKAEAQAANVPLRAYFNTTDSELIFYIKERTDVENNTTEVTS